MPSHLKSICSTLLSTGICLGVQVNQSPSVVFRKAGDDAQLVCTHGQTDYRVMLWYQQSLKHKALKLIGYVEYSRISYEELNNVHFNITGDLSGNTAKNGSLFIVGLNESEHSAMYYCAARYTHWGRSPFNYTKTKHDVFFFLKDLHQPAATKVSIMWFLPHFLITLLGFFTFSPVTESEWSSHNPYRHYPLLQRITSAWDKEPKRFIFYFVVTS